MVDDERCCGTGTCLINAEGHCWCGQRWDGQKMCFAEKAATLPVAGSIGASALPNSPNPPHLTN